MVRLGYKGTLHCFVEVALCLPGGKYNRIRRYEGCFTGAQDIYECFVVGLGFLSHIGWFQMACNLVC